MKGWGTAIFFLYGVIYALRIDPLKTAQTTDSLSWPQCYEYTLYAPMLLGESFAYYLMATHDHPNTTCPELIRTTFHSRHPTDTLPPWFQTIGFVLQDFVAIMVSLISCPMITIGQLCGDVLRCHYQNLSSVTDYLGAENPGLIRILMGLWIILHVFAWPRIFRLLRLWWEDVMSL